jgi:hypothetical protein
VSQTQTPEILKISGVCVWLKVNVGVVGVGGLKPCLRTWKPCGLWGARKGLQVLREGLIPNGCEAEWHIEMNNTIE